MVEEGDNKQLSDLSYGFGKQIGEYLTKNMTNVSSIILRLVGVYGPNQSRDLNSASLIPALCARAALYPKQEFKIKTTGEEKRTYIDVYDIINLLYKMIYKMYLHKFYVTYNFCI